MNLTQNQQYILTFFIGFFTVLLFPIFICTIKLAYWIIIDNIKNLKK